MYTLKTQYLPIKPSSLVHLSFMKHYVMLGAQKVPFNSTVATGSFTLQINKTLYIVFWSLCFCLHWAPLGVTRLKQSLRWMCQLSPRILQVISKVAKAPTIVNEKISSEQKQGSQSWQTPPQTPIYPHFPESDLWLILPFCKFPGSWTIWFIPSSLILHGWKFWC